MASADGLRCVVQVLIFNAGLNRKSYGAETRHHLRQFYLRPIHGVSRDRDAGGLAGVHVHLRGAARTPQPASRPVEVITDTEGSAMSCLTYSGCSGTSSALGRPGAPGSGVWIPRRPKACSVASPGICLEPDRTAGFLKPGAMSTSELLRSSRNWRGRQDRQGPLPPGRYRRRDPAPIHSDTAQPG